MESYEEPCGDGGGDGGDDVLWIDGAHLGEGHPCGGEDEAEEEGVGGARFVFHHRGDDFAERDDCYSDSREDWDERCPVDVFGCVDGGGDVAAECEGEWAWCEASDGGDESFVDSCDECDGSAADARDDVCCAHGESADEEADLVGWAEGAGRGVVWLVGV